MPFLVHKDDAVTSGRELKDFKLSFVEMIPSDMIDQFLQLQVKATNEISQEIFIFTADSLRNPLESWDSSIRFCLIIDSDSLIAYGIGHDDYSSLNTFYIDTIFVDDKFRSLGISTVIIDKFINYVKKESWDLLKAVTQPNNESAIKLLSKAGFEHKKREDN